MFVNFFFTNSIFFNILHFFVSPHFFSVLFHFPIYLTLLTLVSSYQKWDYLSMPISKQHIPSSQSLRPPPSFPFLYISEVGSPHNNSCPQTAVSASLRPRPLFPICIISEVGSPRNNSYPQAAQSALAQLNWWTAAARARPARRGGPSCAQSCVRTRARYDATPSSLTLTIALYGESHLHFILFKLVPQDTNYSYINYTKK